MTELTTLQGGELTLLTQLGRGGMGTVELARLVQGPVERLVAVKTLLGEHAAEDSFRRMFETEARLMAMIRHANVVSVIGAGVSNAGPYFVMEFVEGVSLWELLRKEARAGRRVPLTRVLGIVEQAATGLSAAHELRDKQGRPLSVVHRDVSPQNLLIGTDGVVRLADFGIAKVNQSERTETGVLKGKVGYMAPEQLSFDEPTYASDLFALGVVLFEALTGRRLYGGEYRRAAKAILLDPPPDLMDYAPDMPEELSELLFELLAKEPRDRPSSAREVAVRLARLRASLSDHETLDGYVCELMADEIEALRKKVRESETRKPRSAAPPPRGRARALGVVAAIAAVTVAGLVWSMWGSPEASVGVSTALEAESAAVVEGMAEPVTVHVEATDEASVALDAGSAAPPVGMSAGSQPAEPAESAESAVPNRRRRREPATMRNTTNAQGLVGW